MMNKSTLTFDPIRHRYELDGQWLPGVTTIIGVLSKPQLIQWAANMAVDYIEANGLLRSLSDTDNEFVIDPDLLEQARTAHIRKRDKAADKGTDVHGIAETWVRWCLKEHAGQPMLNLETAPPEILPFANWAHENEVKFLDCEVMAYSELHRYAGRFDLLFEQGGKRYLGDIKTGKGVYPDFFIQMGGYQIAYEHMIGEQLGHAIAGRVILHLNSKTCKPYLSQDYHRDMGAFLNCLALYKALKTFPEMGYQIKP